MLQKRFKLPIGVFPNSARTVFKNEYFSVKSVDNNLSYNRFGVTFRSKAFNTAVLRNRLKRHVFNFFRTESGLFSTNNVSSASSLQTTNYKLQTVACRDLLIILNPPIINLTKDEIQKQLKAIPHSGFTQTK